jgi:hypothetical protein
MTFREARTMCAEGGIGSITPTLREHTNRHDRIVIFIFHASSLVCI